MIHRDLKPENVVLGDHGEVIVLDWGLGQGPHGSARPTQSNRRCRRPDRSHRRSAEIDKTHGRVGTPAYMAPEQVAMSDGQVDNRTDLYGLGAILYEILANRAPAQGTTLEEIYQNVSAGRIPRAREVDLTVPAALDAICAKALSAQSRGPLSERDGAGRRSAALADRRAGVGLSRSAHGATDAVGPQAPHAWSPGKPRRCFW